MQVSHSKIKTWRNCHKSYDYKYNQKLRRKRKARPLVFGSIVHEMIDAVANKKDPWAVLAHYEKIQGRMFKEEIEEYGNIVQDITWIMESFFEFYDNDPLIYLKRNGVKAEIPFEIEIDKGITMIGYIDGFCQNREDKTKWIMEHKTFKDLPNEDERWKSNQAFIYDHVIDVMGWGPSDGIIFDYIRSRPPTWPALTQKGELARANSLVTLPNVFAQFLDENSLNHDDYEEVFNRLEGRVDEYFQRMYTPIKTAAKKIAIDDAVTTSHEIIERGHKDATMNVGRHCTWCDYKLLCEARYNGSDEDFVKERYYDTSSKKESGQEKKRTAKKKVARKKKSVERVKRTASKRKTIAAKRSRVR